MLVANDVTGRTLCYKTSWGILWWCASLQLMPYNTGASYNFWREECLKLDHQVLFKVQYICIWIPTNKVLSLVIFKCKSRKLLPQHHHCDGHSIKKIHFLLFSCTILLHNQTWTATCCKALRHWSRNHLHTVSPVTANLCIDSLLRVIILLPRNISEHWLSFCDACCCVYDHWIAGQLRLQGMIIC